jgi:hypothetical protein
MRWKRSTIWDAVMRQTSSKAASASARFEIEVAVHAIDLTLCQFDLFRARQPRVTLALIACARPRQLQRGGTAPGSAVAAHDGMKLSRARGVTAR